MPRYKSLLIILAAMTAATGSLAAAGPAGSFIQLNRASADLTQSHWRSDLQQMKKIGIHSLIIQWSAEPGILYMDTELPFPERFDTIEKILSAARMEEMRVHIGLFHDSHYWTEITARDRVLRDYFMVRVSQNEGIQKALLSKFKDDPSWIGYYIPDELDDLTWRTPERSALFKRYLKVMCDRLKRNDPDRAISISTFFRNRTAPGVFMESMRTIVSDSGLSRLLIQDGTGTGDPNERYLPIYYDTFRNMWNVEGTTLGCVVELFEQTSAPGEPFSAVPASPARVRRQLKHAAVLSDDIILFTFPEYADPDGGPKAAALYDELAAP